MKSSRSPHTFTTAVWQNISIRTYKKCDSVEKYLLHFSFEKFEKSIAIYLKKCYNDGKMCNTGLLCLAVCFVSKNLVLMMVNCAIYLLIG